MQFKNLEIGQCFRLIGDNEVMMKVAQDRYIRAVREVSSGKLLCQDIGPVSLVVFPCKCSPFRRVLTEPERQFIEGISQGESNADMNQIFERS